MSFVSDVDEAVILTRLSLHLSVPIIQGQESGNSSHASHQNSDSSLYIIVISLSYTSIRNELPCGFVMSPVLLKHFPPSIIGDERLVVL